MNGIIMANGYEDSINLREKTLAIYLQFACKYFISPKLSTMQ